MRMAKGNVRLAIAVCGLGFTLAACKSPVTDSGAGPCATTFAFETGPQPGYSSPSPGYLTLAGSFIEGESVGLQYIDDAGHFQMATGTPESNRGSLTFNGLPSGTRSYAISVSCQKGIDTHTAHNFTIK